MQDCKLAYEKHNAVGYWQVKCRSLFKHGMICRGATPPFPTITPTLCLASGTHGEEDGEIQGQTEDG